jgi:hypothetical protein
MADLVGVCYKNQTSHRICKQLGYIYIGRFFRQKSSRGYCLKQTYATGSEFNRLQIPQYHY